MPWLINPAQLDKFRKSQKSLVILDASLHTDNRNAKQEFADKHIPSAKFFDIEEFNDPAAPNQLIKDEILIGQKLSRLGLRNDYKVIFYDSSANHTSCRALWMMKVFGHNPHQLYILDGGLAAWEKYSGKLEMGGSVSTPKPYTAKWQLQFLRNLDQIKENALLKQEQLVDLRHPVLYAGGPEPVNSIRPGHIPGSISFPYMSFFDNNGLFHPMEKIRFRLMSVAIDFNVPIIAMSGTGISACILDFMLDLMDHSQHSVYEGGWLEWGQSNLYPGENALTERPVVTCLED